MALRATDEWSALGTLSQYGGTSSDHARPLHSWEPVAVKACSEVFHTHTLSDGVVGVVAIETRGAIGVGLEGTQSTQDCASYSWQGQTA